MLNLVNRKSNFCKKNSDFRGICIPGANLTLTFGRFKNIFYICHRGLSIHIQAHGAPG